MTEQQKYEEFAKKSGYIPNISLAAMARINIKKYEKAVNEIRFIKQEQRK